MQIQGILKSIKISKMGFTGSAKLFTELRYRPFTGWQKSIKLRAWWIKSAAGIAKKEKQNILEARNRDEKEKKSINSDTLLIRSIKKAKTKQTIWHIAYFNIVLDPLSWFLLFKRFFVVFCLLLGAGVTYFPRFCFCFFCAFWSRGIIFHTFLFAFFLLLGAAVTYFSVFCLLLIGGCVSQCTLYLCFLSWFFDLKTFFNAFSVAVRHIFCLCLLFGGACGESCFRDRIFSCF